MNRCRSLYPQLLNWMSLSWYDIKSRYRRTIIGPFWIVLNTLISIVFLGLVYKTLFNIPLPEFLPFVAAGIMIWTLMATSITEATTSFIGHKILLQGIPLRQELILVRMVCRNAIIFFHNLFVLMLMFLVFDTGLSGYFLLTLPGLVMVVLSLFFAGLILAYFSARFRDLPQMVNSLIGVLFLVTPIIWPQRLLGDNQLLALLNPLTHLVSVVREPLLGRSPSVVSWLVTGLTVAGLACCAFAVHCRYRQRLIYWL